MNKSIARLISTTQKYVPLIPLMTSATLPSGVVATTGSWTASTWHPYHAWGRATATSVAQVASTTAQVTNTYTFASVLPKGLRYKFNFWLGDDGTGNGYWTNIIIRVTYSDGATEDVYTSAGGLAAQLRYFETKFTAAKPISAITFIGKPSKGYIILGAFQLYKLV